MVGAVSLQSKEEGDHSGEKGEELFFDLLRWSDGAGRDATGGIRRTKKTPLDVFWGSLLPAPAAETQSKKVSPKQVKCRTWGHGLIWAALISVAFQGQMRNNRTETKDGHGQRHNPSGKSGLITAVQEGDRCLPEAAIRGWTREGLSLSQPSSLHPLLNHREDRAGTTSHGFDLPVLD